MPESITANPGAVSLDSAFDALKTYDNGSSRGALVPIDETVVASLNDAATRIALEQRLISALEAGGSSVTCEYICSKLAMIGSDRSVPTLAALLGKPEFATAARNALEAIPGRQATKALRDSLSKVDGLQRIGVINSIGARRDVDSVRSLTKQLKSSEPEIASAAAAALGEIATTAAAKSLRSFLLTAPEAIRLRVDDAMLTCAERLLAAGRKLEAQKLYTLLGSRTQPDHVQLAAARGLKLASQKK